MLYEQGVGWVNDIGKELTSLKCSYVLPSSVTPAGRVMMLYMQVCCPFPVASSSCEKCILM